MQHRQLSFVRQSQYFAWLLFVLPLLPVVACAETVHKWQDAQGHWHFGDVQNVPDNTRSQEVAITPAPAKPMGQTANSGPSQTRRYQQTLNDIAADQAQQKQQQASAARAAKTAQRARDKAQNAAQRCQQWKEAQMRFGMSPKANRYCQQ